MESGQASQNLDHVLLYGTDGYSIGFCNLAIFHMIYPMAEEDGAASQTHAVQRTSDLAQGLFSNREALGCGVVAGALPFTELLEAGLPYLGSPGAVPEEIERDAKDEGLCILYCRDVRSAQETKENLLRQVLRFGCVKHAAREECHQGLAITTGESLYRCEMPFRRGRFIREAASTRNGRGGSVAS